MRPIKESLPATEGSGPIPEDFGEDCGGKGGVPYRIFTYAPARITRVTVWSREYVDGIQLETDQGALPLIGARGKHLDVRKDMFELAPDEVLTGISVEYWHYVDRIGFQTNQKSYGPFGGFGGRLKKELRAPPGRIVVGFAGRHWEFVDSIHLVVL